MCHPPAAPLPQSVYKTFQSHALAIAAAIPPRHAVAHSLAADAAARIARICDEGLSREAAAPEALARRRALRLRVAALCCPIIGFAANAVWEVAAAPAVHGKAAALGASILSIVLFLAMLGAVYSLLAAARTPAADKSGGAAAAAGSPSWGGGAAGSVPPPPRSSGNSPGVELGF